MKNLKECPYCGSKSRISVNNYLTIERCEACKKSFVKYINEGKILISKLDWVVEENRLQSMQNLPSEQKKAIEKAIVKFEKTGKLSIEEPCNCGSHIQHNNGGNYHTWYDIAFDSGKYFIREGSTCELNPPYEWEESTKEEVYQLIQNCADWL